MPPLRSSRRTGNGGLYGEANTRILYRLVIVRTSSTSLRIILMNSAPVFDGSEDVLTTFSRTLDLGVSAGYFAATIAVQVTAKATGASSSLTGTWIRGHYIPSI
jgi:hypothetical protein